MRALWDGLQSDGGGDPAELSALLGARRCGRRGQLPAVRGRNPSTCLAGTGSARGPSRPPRSNRGEDRRQRRRRDAGGILGIRTARVRLGAGPHPRRPRAASPQRLGVDRHSTPLVDEVIAIAGQAAPSGSGQAEPTDHRGDIIDVPPARKRRRKLSRPQVPSSASRNSSYGAFLAPDIERIIEPPVEQGMHTSGAGPWSARQFSQRALYLSPNFPRTVARITRFQSRPPSEGE